MRLLNLYKNMTPLCFLPNGKLVCYYRGGVQVLRDNQVEKIVPFPVSVKEKMLGWSKKMSRLFRFGFRAAIALDNDHLVLSRGNSLFELDLQTGSFSSGWYCGDGIRPLVLSKVDGIYSFPDGVYFGGYLKNNEKNPVNIYRRKDRDNWEVVFSFPKNTINHVHAIVPDKYRNCLWVLTGDFGDAAAIWKFIDGFNKVERFAYGDQKWRGCVAFALPEGLLYATDTPFADNHIFLLIEDGTIETLANLFGSCIYGCQWKDKYVFSSTVEADGRNETFLKLLFCPQRGSGIVDNYVHMYVGDIVNGFHEVYKERKDWLPFVFQFGAFKFPAGVNNGDKLYFQPVATEQNDLSLVSLD